MGYLFSSCWLVDSHRPTHMTLFVFTLQNLTVRIYCWRHQELDLVNLEKSNWCWLGRAPLLPVSFHSVGSAMYATQEMINCLTQLSGILRKQTDWQDNAYGCNRYTNVMVVINNFMNGFNANSSRQNSCLAPLTEQRICYMSGYRDIPLLLCP